MVKFFEKFENRVIKIARVNSILISKSIHLLQFCTVMWVRCDVDIFELTTRAQSINKVGQLKVHAYPESATTQWSIIIITYHDFLPTPRRDSHVKSDKTHTQSSRYTP